MNLVTEVVTKQLQLNPNLLYLRGTPEQPASKSSAPSATPIFCFMYSPFLADA